MKKFIVILSYAIDVNAPTAEYAEEIAMKKFNDCPPRAEDMNIEIEEGD